MPQLTWQTFRKSPATSQNASLAACASFPSVGATPATQEGIVCNGSSHDSTGHTPQLTGHVAGTPGPLQNLSFLDAQEPRSSAERAPVVPAMQAWDCVSPTPPAESHVSGHSGVASNSVSHAIRQAFLHFFLHVLSWFSKAQ